MLLRGGQRLPLVGIAGIDRLQTAEQRQLGLLLHALLLDALEEAQG